MVPWEHTHLMVLMVPWVDTLLMVLMLPWVDTLLMGSFNGGWYLG